MAQSEARATFERLAEELRPALHRYCARLVGSAIDGEDVVQDALTKAVAALASAGKIESVRSWLFRIAHNAALDFLRRRRRREALFAAEAPEATFESSDEDRRFAVAAGLQTFMRLPVSQRSAVILMDVLGYTLADIAAITEASVPAVKSALHRGRVRLRELADEPDDAPAPPLGERERARLREYVERFNAYDFDAVRDMLADDVRLEVVQVSRMHGRVEVGRYFTNYAKVSDWRFAAGVVEGRPAALVSKRDDPAGTPRYFVLVEFTAERVTAIRDFRYAAYAIDGAQWDALGTAGALQWGHGDFSADT